MNKQVQQIREEIERCLQQEPFLVKDLHDAYSFALEQMLKFVNSLPEEPVSDDLKQAAVDAFKKVVDDGENSYFNIFKAGADWKEQKLMQDAIDGVVYKSLVWPGNVVGNLPFYSQFKQHESVKLIIIRRNNNANDDR